MRFPPFCHRWSSTSATAISLVTDSCGGPSKKATMGVRIQYRVFLEYRLHAAADLCALVLILCCALLGPLGVDSAVVSLALICSFSRMRSHLGLEGDVKPENVPEETVLAVADVLRGSSALRVSEDGKHII
jgi:hypothetical protein